MLILRGWDVWLRSPLTGTSIQIQQGQNQDYSKGQRSKALPANDFVPHPKLGIDRTIHLPASWSLARLRKGNIFCTRDHFDGRCKQTVGKKKKNLHCMYQQKDWIKGNNPVYYGDVLVLVLTSPQSVREWGYGGSLRGLSPQAQRPAGRKGTGTAWGEGWRPFASAPGTSRTLGKIRMQVCRKEQEERKETLKDGGGGRMSIWKNLLRTVENCEGQEQNWSCFRSITALDHLHQRWKSDKYTGGQNFKLGQRCGSTLIFIGKKIMWTMNLFIWTQTSFTST